MDQRLEFVTDHQRGLYAMTELGRRHGVSRKTGYKLLARYAADGARGLAERSHAPHRCPHRIDDDLATLLVAARGVHPSWGPATLVQYLAPRHPRVAAWPAISTVADLLKRHDLVRPRRRRRPIVHALKEHHVGLEESDDGIWSLYLGAMLLGKIDEATMKVYG